jgi:ribonuclease P protein component
MEKASNTSCSLFPKSNRLLKAADFSNLRSNFKKKFSGPFMLILKENDLGYARLGISVSKKSANAVYRNRAKRLIRETFRVNPIKSSGLDLLVIFNKSTKVKDQNPSLMISHIETLFSEVIS